jgi:hypothetical protein
MANLSICDGAERRASAAAGSRSEARADAGGSQLHAFVRHGVLLPVEGTSDPDQPL